MLTRSLAKFFFILAISVFSLTSAQARTFTLVNNCSFPVWFGFFGSKENPKPANNNYKLEANGGTNIATIPSAGSGTIWSGVVAGRTNCTGTSCETADCGGGSGACTRGFNQPATQGEFTLSATGRDFYDVEVINGVNLPLSVTPNVAAQGKDPYFCGSPGAVTPSAGLGACSWQFSPPLVEYQWVQNGGASCQANTDCTSGTVCGLSFNPGQASLLKKTCGKLLGYWTANQICGVQRNYGAPFNCSDKLPSPQNNLTWWHLMACVDIGSCYHQGAGTDCCGCVNWDKLGISVPAAPFTKQCENANPNWVNVVQPSLAWLKQACPSVYTYPYDDMSSTFTCQSMVNNQNEANYTITFCPGDSSPIPPPATKYSYYVTLGHPFSKVTINDNIPCPDANGNPRCLVSDQAVGSVMTIAGTNPNRCNLTIQSDGKVGVNPNSTNCFIDSTPASTSKPGAISLPSKF